MMGGGDRFWGWRDGSAGSELGGWRGCESCYDREAAGPPGGARGCGESSELQTPSSQPRGPGRGTVAAEAVEFGVE